MQNMSVEGAMDMERKVDSAEPPATVQKWPKNCIFRVPRHFKGGDVAFEPQVVALGPFHHWDAALRPMEEHKLRAVRHLLRRAGKTLGDLAVAVEGVAADLEDAYAGLGGEWRGKYRDRFLQMMIADGCFLLEFMRNYTREKRREKSSGDYSPNDSVFGPHAVEHTAAFVIRDMLLIENQLPLILLRTIVAVESGQTPSDSSINKLVFDFLYQLPPDDVRSRLGLHPLDLYRWSLLQQTSSSLAISVSLTAEDDDEPAAKAAPRSAQKLYEAGVWFRRRKPDCLDNIDFRKSRCNMLEMPRVTLDDATENRYRNLMAFEALHSAGAGNGVTAFVLFMRDLVDCEDDVELLRRKGILDNRLAGGDRAVVSLFNRLTTDVAEINKSRLCGVHRDLERYCVNKSLVLRVVICKSWAKLRTSHLSNIWTVIALLVGIYLLGTDAVQTVYSVLSYKQAQKQGAGGPSPPPPRGGRWNVHY